MMNNLYSYFQVVSVMAALSASSIEQREEAASLKKKVLPLKGPQRKIIIEGMSVVIIYDCTQTIPKLRGLKQ